MYWSPASHVSEVEVHITFPLIACLASLKMYNVSSHRASSFFSHQHLTLPLSSPVSECSVLSALNPWNSWPLWPVYVLCCLLASHLESSNRSHNPITITESAVSLLWLVRVLQVKIFSQWRYSCCLYPNSIFNDNGNVRDEKEQNDSSSVTGRSLTLSITQKETLEHSVPFT